MPVQHYNGGCQCGAVRYEVDTDLDKTITCNCSRCQRRGSVLSFAGFAINYVTHDGVVQSPGAFQ